MKSIKKLALVALFPLFLANTAQAGWKEVADRAKKEACWVCSVASGAASAACAGLGSYLLCNKNAREMAAVGVLMAPAVALTCILGDDEKAVEICYGGLKGEVSLGTAKFVAKSLIFGGLAGGTYGFYKLSKYLAKKAQ